MCPECRAEVGHVDGCPELERDASPPRPGQGKLCVQSKHGPFYFDPTEVAAVVPTPSGGATIILKAERTFIACPKYSADRLGRLIWPGATELRR